MEEFYYKNIYYRKNEHKAGLPTLVFVHGISGSSSAWLPYEKKFEGACNILNLDLRGHGKSKKLKGGNEYAIKKFSDDLYELINFLRMEKFILVSHSFGVLIALQFMKEYMDSVEKAVLISPHYAPKNIFGAKLIRPLLKLMPVLNLIPMSRDRGEHIDYAKYKNSGDWNLPRMWADVRNTSLIVYLNGTKKSYEVDYEDFLDQISIPILLIHGKKDSIFPLSHVQRMQSKIKNSRLKVIENSNHILVLNNFSEVSRSIESFIGLPFS